METTFINTLNRLKINQYTKATIEFDKFAELVSHVQFNTSDKFDYQIGDGTVSEEYTKALEYLKSKLSEFYYYSENLLPISRPRNTQPNERYDRFKKVRVKPKTLNEQPVENGVFATEKDLEDSYAYRYNFQLLPQTNTTGKKLIGLVLLFQRTVPSLNVEPAIWNINNFINVRSIRTIKISNDKNGQVNFEPIIYALKNITKLNEEWAGAIKKNLFKEKITKSSIVVKLQRLKEELEFDEIKEYSYFPTSFDLKGFKCNPELEVRLTFEDFSSPSTVNIKWSQNHIQIKVDFDTIKETVKLLKTL